MGDNPFNSLVICISGSVWIGQNILIIKNVQALVLHGSHIEIADRHDHIDIQVIFSTIALFIPFHGLFQCAERVTALTGIFLFHIKTQVDLAP